MDRILTVVTPAVSKDLTTLDVVKSEIGIFDDSNATDAKLSRQITAASRAAANMCNREFALETVSEQFRPYPFIDSSSLTNIPEFVFLARLPVASIATLTEDDVVLVEGTDFECDKQTGRLVRLSNDMPLRWHFRKLVCQYDGGYTVTGDSPTIEPDVQQAVVEIVKDMWFASTRDPMLRSINQPGLGLTEYWVGAPGSATGWPPRITDLLSPWQGRIF